MFRGLGLKRSDYWPLLENSLILVRLRNMELSSPISSIVSSHNPQATTCATMLAFLPTIPAHFLSPPCSSQLLRSQHFTDSTLFSFLVANSKSGPNASNNQIK